jgi:hypothetical protein
MTTLEKELFSLLLSIWEEGAREQVMAGGQVIIAPSKYTFKFISKKMEEILNLLKT